MSYIKKTEKKNAIHSNFTTILLLYFNILIVMICFLACKSKDKSFNIVTPVNVGDYINPDDSFVYMMKDLADENFLAIYPGLAQKYTTPLQVDNFIKSFKNSQEFKEVQADMKGKLNSLLKQTYAMPISRAEGFITVLFGYGGKSGIGNYNLKYGGFSIPLEEVKEDIKSKRIGRFWFNDLNIHNITIKNPFKGAPETFSWRELLFNVDKETAVKIEGADLWLIFNLKNSFKENYIETRDVGIIIVDPSTERFLYGQKYSNFAENTAWKKKEKLSGQ